MILLNERSNNNSPFHFTLAVINDTCICCQMLHYHHLCVKDTVLRKNVERPCTGLKDCGGGGRYSSLRKHLKGHSPAKTGPQQNLISDVLRTAFLFRENTRLNKLANTPALCAGLAEKHSELTSALPLSSLLLSYGDTYLYLYLCLALCCGTQMCFTLHEFFPEEEAAAVPGRCKYCLAHILPSPLDAHTHRERYAHTEQCYCTLNYFC